MVATHDSAPGDGVGHDTGRDDGPDRRVGRPARLTRDMILDAALAMDRRSISVSAVAKRLGVARNAVRYHVHSREDLLALVVEHELNGRLARLTIPTDDWAQAMRVVAQAMFDALVDEDALAVLSSQIPGTALLEPSETLLRTLMDGGFAPATAWTALGLMARLVYSAARDEVLGRHGQDSRTEELRSVLVAQPRRFAAIAEASAAADGRASRPEVMHEVEIVIVGLAAIRG